jgi:hypothetical protein
MLDVLVNAPSSPLPEPAKRPDLDKLRVWAAGEPPLPPLPLPTAWRNVAVRLVIEQLALGLRCDDMFIQRFRVVGVDSNLTEVLHMEGGNDESKEPKVGLNSLDLSPELLRNLFHAARCLREYRRTGNLDYSRGYESFLEQVLRQVQPSGETPLIPLTSDLQEHQRPSPQITLTVPPAVEVKAGKQAPFPVRVTRQNADDGVEVRVDGVPPGVTLTGLTIRKHETEVVANVTADEHAEKGDYPVVVRASCGSVTAPHQNTIIRISRD